MKIIIVLLVLSLFVFTGCGEKSKTKYDKTMEEYATNYYNSLLKGTEGLTSTKITVAQLKEAFDLQIVDYDMSKLSACTDESYVELTIDPSNNNISTIDYHMTCEK